MSQQIDKLYNLGLRPEEDIAIVGMSGYFPSSPSLEIFWDNIKSGRDCIERATSESSNVVNARGVLADIDKFDADFFGISPAEAKLLDPQHRMMLECVWSALDHAGVDPWLKDKIVSVYLACAPSTYYGSIHTGEVSEQYQRMLATAPDFIAARISYLLDLRGESLVISTGCSSSLVAVHNACQSLLIGQSDIAVAGGVTVDSEQLLNYTVQDGMIFSEDGYCRAFDYYATGTVPASGVGVVVLKRLVDAIESHDYIHAIIKSSAVNNDGHSKVGFMAPSVDGQSEVISSALAIAGIPVESIGYVEAHGTGTRLGDPIEVHALTKAYRQYTEKKTYCALTSLKANFGHMDRASGIAGLIKVVLCLKNKTIPKSIHFERPNDEIKFEDSPFYVPTETEGWVPLDNTPRRAGVSSFGVGGTNAHVILQESPQIESVIETELPSVNQQPLLLKLSAHSESALSTVIEDIRQFVQDPANNHISKSNLAYSLQSKAALRYRTAIVIQRDIDEKLQHNSPVIESSKSNHCAFVFPGQGMLIRHRGAELYQICTVFNKVIAECIKILPNSISTRLEQIVLGRTGTVRYSKEMQPILLAIEYAYAKQWMSMGVTPSVLIGHSIGELAAACVSGVYDLSSVLHIAIKRGELMERCVGRGKMLSAFCSIDDVMALSGDSIEVAAVNSTSSCILSGNNQHIEKLADDLASAGIMAGILELDFAAHSSHMDGIIEEFCDYVAQFKSGHGCIPIISSLTGKLVQNEEMNSPQYWGKQIRHAVIFKDCIEYSISRNIQHFVECGPSQVLSQLIQQSYPVMTYPSGTSVESNMTAVEQLAMEVGHLWTQGFDVQWPMEPCQKIELPRYPFQRRSFWLDHSTQQAASRLVKSSLVGSWLHTEQWQVDTLTRSRRRNLEQRNIVLIGQDYSAASLVAFFEREGGRVFQLASWSTLLLLGSEINVTNIIDCRGNTRSDVDSERMPADFLSNWLREYQEILSLLRGNQVNLITIGSGYYQTDSGEFISPLRRMQRSLLRVMQQEWLGLTTKVIDIGCYQISEISPSLLLAEIIDNQYTDACIRDGKVMRRTFVQAVPALQARILKPKGVYVITGGSGNVGIALAEVLVRYAGGVIVFLSRTAIRDQDLQRIKAEWSGSGGHDFTIDAITADVTSLPEMQQAADYIYTKYGVVNGIIHGAAFTNSAEFNFLEFSTDKCCTNILDAKVNGVKHIDQCFKTEDCDFILLCSSVSSEIGGLRYGIYASANAFIEGYALAKRSRGQMQWLAVAWDAWLFDKEGYTKYASLKSLAMAVVEGQEVFLRSLSAEGSCFVISTCPLQYRIEQTRTANITASVAVDTHADPVDLASIRTIVREVAVDILGEEVDDTFNFSKQGVDSLTTLQIITTLKHRLGFDLPLGKVFRTLDISGLIEVAITCYGNIKENNVPKITSLGDGREYPTSALQSRWLEVAKYKYGYIQMPVRLVGKLNVEVLEKSLACLFARHSVLRTVYQYRSEKDYPIQVILTTPFQLIEIDLRAADTKQRENQWEEFVMRESEREFDFSSEVPICIKLLKMDDEEHILWCHMHHIVFDGTSSTIFLQELDQYYSAALNNSIYNPPPVLQYSDFSVWQRSYLKHEASNKAREYWKNQFKDCSGCLRIPATYKSESKDSNNLNDSVSLASFHKITIELDEADLIRRSASEWNTTVFTLLASVFTVLLHKITSETDIVFGTTLAGRSELGAEKIIGVFVNPLPVRVKIDLQEKFYEHVNRTAETVLGFHEHQNYPLESLVKEVDPFVGTDINETFRCYILMQNYPKSKDAIGDLKMSKVSVDGLVKHQLMRDFELTIYPIDQGFTLEFGYRDNLYQASDVEIWGQWYMKIMRGGFADAQQNIDEL